MLAATQQGLCVARIRAPSAGNALLTIDVMFALDERVGMNRTYFNAFSATDAAHRVQQDLGLAMQRFRIMTPFAPHIATLQKNGCANSRSVVQGKPLDFGNHAGHFMFTYIHPLKFDIYPALAVVCRFIHLIQNVT